jgi:hypothetical protein
MEMMIGVIIRVNKIKLENFSHLDIMLRGQD